MESMNILYECLKPAIFPELGHVFSKAGGTPTADGGTPVSAEREVPEPWAAWLGRGRGESRFFHNVRGESSIRGRDVFVQIGGVFAMNQLFSRDVHNGCESKSKSCGFPSGNVSYLQQLMGGLTYLTP